MKLFNAGNHGLDPSPFDHEIAAMPKFDTRSQRRRTSGCGVRFRADVGQIDPDGSRKRRLLGPVCPQLLRQQPCLKFAYQENPTDLSSEQVTLYLLMLVKAPFNCNTLELFNFEFDLAHLSGVIVETTFVGNQNLK